MDNSAELSRGPQYTKKLETKTIGDVPEQVLKEIIDTVKNVFVRMGYDGDPPETISVSQGAVLLPSGEKTMACYGYDETGKPGRIYLSIEESQAAFSNSEIPLNIAAAAYVAHEAVEHVNNMRGKKLLSSHKLLSHEEHQAETEDEANAIAREVISEQYGWTIRFGDEVHRDNRDSK